MELRPYFFWLHMVIGLTVGLGVFFLSTTGLLLVFEPQIVSYAESSLKTVTVPAANPFKLSLNVLVEKAKGDQANVLVTSVSVYSDPDRSVLIQLGQNDVVYMDPYSGHVLGRGATGLRGAFSTATDLHRWFGTEGPNREVAKAIKGVWTCLFGLSLLTGLYLWWPRQWTRTVFKVIGIPQFRFSGKQRDFNWHNAIGFWSAPWLLIIVITGLIMIYPWANNLLYRMTGSEPPVLASQMDGAKAGKDRTKHGHQKAKTPSFDKFLATAAKQDPQWISVNIRPPQGNRPNVGIGIQDPTTPNTYGSALLTLNSQTGEVVKWEPYESFNLGRKARAWVRALHTGEAGGIVGQAIAALAVMGAMLLVWTGFNLAFRRFFE